MNRYEQLKIEHPRYFDADYLHEHIFLYAKKEAKKKKMPVWTVIQDIISSGSTIASIIGGEYEDESR